MARIVIDNDVCPAGWGPAAHGPNGWRIGHYCGKEQGHAGRHVCDVEGCRSWLVAGSEQTGGEQP